MAPGLKRGLLLLALFLGVVSLAAAMAPPLARAETGSGMGIGTGTFALEASLRLPPRPDPPRLLNDLAGLLPAEERSALEGRLQKFHQQNGVTFVVVTVPSLNNATIEEFANRLFSSWGIGRKGEDRGLLLLIAPRERKARFEVGYGLEGDLPDAFCGQVLDEEALPAFSQGNYAAGINAALDRINARLGGPPLPKATSSSVIEHKTEDNLPWWVIPLFLAVFLLYFSAGGRWRRFPGAGGGLPPVWWGGGLPGSRRRDDDWWGGGFGGGGGAGSGFGGFGGGSSGGGGASRGW